MSVPERLRFPLFMLVLVAIMVICLQLGSITTKEGGKTIVVPEGEYLKSLDIQSGVITTTKEQPSYIDIYDGKTTNSADVIIKIDSSALPKNRLAYRIIIKK